MITVGIFLTALTFPGAMVREAAHLMFCRMFKLAIFDVRFLELAPPFGHVQHEHSNHFGAAAGETLGPFFINSALCVLFCWAVFLPVWELRIFDPLAYLFYWLGFSMGVHALPGTADIKHLWKLAPAAAKRGNVLALLTFPLLAALRAVEFARAFWPGVAYAVALGVGVPLALVRIALSPGV
ncbi:MAG: hypothetical protein M3P27_01970 [Acidobacteriota bacterium]|nr:hypothetical protein [Acidobacteriota bacterium]